MTAKFKFAEGEKVLCFHGPLIYEAKALKYTVTKDKQIKYYIHYAGWNKNWDEWVPENRVLKYNEINLQRQKEVYKQHSSTTGKNRKSTPKNKRSGESSKDGGGSSGGSESRASTPSKDVNNTPLAATSTSRSNRLKHSSTPVATKESDQISKKDDTTKHDDTNKDFNSSKDDVSKKKRATSTSNEKAPSTSGVGNANSTSTAGVSTTSTTSASSTSSSRLDSLLEGEETFLSKSDVKIKIPDELKQYLADDWDAVTRQHKLHDIPAKITVQNIVDQYIAYKKNSKATPASKEVAINEVVNGIIEYFNVMLGSQLLYKFERQQYAEILQQHPDTPHSRLYGAFHLLRLFVKLGSMLGYTALDEKTLQLLLTQLHEFLKFLVKNNDSYFNMSTLITATPEYHRHTQ